LLEQSRDLCGGTRLKLNQLGQQGSSILAVVELLDHVINVVDIVLVDKGRNSRSFFDVLGGRGSLWGVDIEPACLVAIASPAAFSTVIGGSLECQVAIGISGRSQRSGGFIEASSRLLVLSHGIQKIGNGTAVVGSLLLWMAGTRGSRQAIQVTQRFGFVGSSFGGWSKGRVF